jgi:hypothetical protein
MRQVGQVQQEIAQLRLHFLEGAFLTFQFVAQSRDFSHERRRIFAFALGNADLLGQRVAFCLCVLRLRLDFLAARLERFKARNIDDGAARAQPGGHAREVVAK